MFLTFQQRFFGSVARIPGMDAASSAVVWAKRGSDTGLVHSLGVGVQVIELVGINDVADVHCPLRTEYPPQSSVVITARGVSCRGFAATRRG